MCTAVLNCMRKESIMQKLLEQKNIMTECSSVSCNWFYYAVRFFAYFFFYYFTQFTNYNDGWTAA